MAPQRNINWPDTSWPSPWPTSKPEPLLTVSLACGCEPSFPRPAPAIGSVVVCLRHGGIRVVASTTA